MEHLLVGQVAARHVVPVEERGHVREALVDPRQLARVGVVHEQVLELVGDDALVELGPIIRRVAVAPGCGARVLADAVGPVEGIEHDDVHAHAGHEVGREVAGGVGRDRAVVVAVVLHVVDQGDQRVACGVAGIRGIHLAEVRLVDGDDLVCQLVAQVVDLFLGERELRGEVVGARGELVVRVVVKGGVEAMHPSRRRAVEWRALRHVDVDRRALIGRAAVDTSERLVVGAARRAVVDRHDDGRVSGAAVVRRRIIAVTGYGWRREAQPEQGYNCRAGRQPAESLCSQGSSLRTPRHCGVAFGVSRRAACFSTIRDVVAVSAPM